MFTGLYEKIFETKIFVPWDTPGVAGVPIFLGPRSRIMPISNPSYLGSMWTPYASATPGKSRKSKIGWSLVWSVFVAEHFSRALSDSPPW